MYWGIMSMRLSLVFVLALQLVSPAAAKKKVLPDEVLKAQTVIILILPDGGLLTNETDVHAIQDDMEKAFEKWGRFRSVYGMTADLVIVGRRGHAEAPKLSLPPPVTLHPNTGTAMPDRNAPGMPGPSAAERQRTVDELRLEEDSFEVYRGGVDSPLEKPPLWQYKAKGALHGPKVAAVEKFRKAIDESEKQRQQKP
jgi:hypothetical protein